MYIIDKELKNDPEKRWSLPDRVFFAAGACHILANAFMDRFSTFGFSAIWIKPGVGHTGNHIVVVKGNLAFDYHGYSDWSALLAHTRRKAGRWWPGWCCEATSIPKDVLVSERMSREYDGLWLREPRHFFHNALPRAHRFLDRFPPPRKSGSI